MRWSNRASKSDYENLRAEVMSQNVTSHSKYKMLFVVIIKHILRMRGNNITSNVRTLHSNVDSLHHIFFQKPNLSYYFYILHFAPCFQFSKGMFIFRVIPKRHLPTDLLTRKFQPTEVFKSNVYFNAWQTELFVVLEFSRY